MDYLLSLVGKDQDTIVEAIKELAQNGEKVKIQKKEIDDLKCELEEGKEEIHYRTNLTKSMILSKIWNMILTNLMKNSK